MNGETLPDRSWQPDDWFPASVPDAAGYKPGQHLNGRISKLRQILPLPLEQVMTPDLTALTALSEKIRSAATNTAVIQLAHQLISRELDLVFPILAILSTGSKSDALMIDRLNLVIRERACPTLYLSGWFAFQKSYPSRILSRALSILCQILAIRQPPEAADQSDDGPASAPSLPLISRIASPASRLLIRRIIHHLDVEELTLTDMMTRYQIQDNLPFGAELIAQAFINGDSSIYQDGHLLFAKALKQSGQATKIALLRHFFSLKDLQPAIYNHFCQQVYRQLGDPAGPDPVWHQLRAKDRRVFREWVFAATIGSHCRLQPQKARLYQRYADLITQIERWDENTLLIHFPDFLIADSRRSPLLAIYYSRKTASDEHPFELAHGEFRPNPADPAIPRRQIDDAIRSGNFEGIIGLPFDPEGIRLTSTYLSLCLRDRPSRIWRWLHR